MPRADLHYALAVDREIYDASRVEPGLLDPVVRVEGGLPGIARPFMVLRRYQGPQGVYIEHFLIRDRRGAELYRAPVQRIALEGEMFENDFVNEVAHLEISDAGDYEIVCFVGETEVGRVPLFVEIGQGGDPRIAAEETFKKAVSKGEIVWLTVPPVPAGRRTGKAHTQPVWFLYDNGKLFLLSGPGEQDVPGLADAAEVEITARSKDLRSRVARVRAKVRRIPADSDEFGQRAEKMLAGRLNLPDGDAALDRWARDCVMVELTPTFSESAAAV